MEQTPTVTTHTAIHRMHKCKKILAAVLIAIIFFALGYFAGAHTHKDSAMMHRMQPGQQGAMRGGMYGNGRTGGQMNGGMQGTASGTPSQMPTQTAPAQ